VKVGMIDASKIDAMISQLRSVAAQTQVTGQSISTETDVKKPSFGDALKASLDQVNNIQTQSQQLGQSFAMGDDKVNLSDVMISMQKANISFQTTIQVRNKLVSAYHEIMNMQI
jgi:flagellar hook-basal body complex protein FliE